MEFVWGFIFGGIITFIVMIFANRAVERGYEKQIRFYKEEIDRLDEWVARGKQWK